MRCDGRVLLNSEVLLLDWPHMQRDAADAINAAFDSVASNNSADAFGRAGEDQVARLQVAPRHSRPQA